MEYNHELLTVLMEECAEVQQEAAKLIRFGIDAEYNGERSIDKFEKEVGDLFAMILLLEKRGLIDQHELEKHKRAKLDKLKVWSNLV